MLARHSSPSDMSHGSALPSKSMSASSTTSMRRLHMPSLSGRRDRKARAARQPQHLKAPSNYPCLLLGQHLRISVNLSKTVYQNQPSICEQVSKSQSFPPPSFAAAAPSYALIICRHTAEQTHKDRLQVQHKLHKRCGSCALLPSGFSRLPRPGEAQSNHGKVSAPAAHTRELSQAGSAGFEHLIVDSPAKQLQTPTPPEPSAQPQSLKLSPDMPCTASV